MPEQSDNRLALTRTGSIVTTVNLSNLAAAGVNGFPFVFYGSDPYGNHVNGQPLAFPVQLNSVSALTTDVTYALSVTEPAPGDLDISFDEWLIPSATCAGGPQCSLEVMVAPYFNFAWAPAGQFIGTFMERVSVDGPAKPMAFNVYCTGTGAGHEIIFFPRAGQISSGNVRLNLLDFLNAGASAAGLDSGKPWPPQIAVRNRSDADATRSRTMPSGTGFKDYRLKPVESCSD